MRRCAYWMCCLLALAPGLSPAAVSFTVERGRFEQGGLLFCRTQPGATVLVDGRPVRVSADGRFVFGLDRDAPETVLVSVAMPGKAADVQMLPVMDKEFPTQSLTFRQGGGDASPELLARMEAERAANVEARARDSEFPFVFGDFVWPATGRITGVYGSQRIINGTPRQPHYGVDVAGPIGTPIYAPADGVVSLAYPNMLLAGSTIYLDHGHGVSSAFLHLSKILVSEGQFVTKGERIGLMGKTGRVTGSHLDWRVNWFEARVDPVQLSGPMPAWAAAPVAAKNSKASGGKAKAARGGKGRSKSAKPVKAKGKPAPKKSRRG